MTTKRTILRRFFRDHSALVLFTLLAGLLNNFITLTIPVFVGKYYQLAFHTRSPRAWLLDRYFDIHDIRSFFIWFGILLLAKTLFTFFEKFLTGKSGETFSKDLRERLFPAQLSFTQQAFERKSYGKYLLRYSGDLGAIQRYVTKGILRFGIDALFMTFAFLLLLTLNVRMTLYVFTAFLLFFALAYVLNNHLKVLTVKRRNIRSELLSFVSSRLHGLLTVKVFNREPVESRKFNTSSGRLYGFGIRYFRVYGFITALFPFFLYSSLLFVFYYSYRLRQSDPNTFSAHALIIYIVTLIHLLPVLRRTLEVTLVWQAGDVSLQKILRIFNSPMEAKDSREDAKFENPGIRIQGLEYKFGEHTVYSGLSFDIPPFTTTWVKGEPGSGKSTLFKILLGIYPLSKGDIYLDGEKADMRDVFALRKNMTLVSDEVPLIGKTVFEAVSYSRKEEKMEKAAKVLEELQAFIAPDQRLRLDQRLLDGGTNLSLSQRRTLQIARALLTKKRILLLDDPFQGLDVRTRTHFASILHKLKSKRTILIASGAQYPEIEFDRVVDISSPASIVIDGKR